MELEIPQQMPRSRCQPPLAAGQANQLHYRRSRPVPNPQQPSFSQQQGAVSGGHLNAGDIAADAVSIQVADSTSQPVAAIASSPEPLFRFSRQPKRKRPLSLAPLRSSVSPGENDPSQANPSEGQRNRNSSRAAKATGQTELVEDHENMNSAFSDINNPNTCDPSSSSLNSSLPQPCENPGFPTSSELLRQQFYRIGNSAAKMIQTMQSQMAEYVIVEKQLSDLINEKCASEAKLSALFEEVGPSGCRKLPVVRLNVGGERFTVPVQTLLGRCRNSPKSCAATATSSDAFGADEAAAVSESSKEDSAGQQDACAFFHALLHTYGDEPRQEGEVREREGEGGREREREGATGVNVFTDATGAIFLDRDPETFRHVLNYLRGYRQFQMLEEDQLRRLRTDARYYGLPGLLRLLEDEEPGAAPVQFQPGPGVNPERNRLRVMYGVAVVGDAVLVTGRHRITYEVITADYIGLGLISDSCVSKDQEFHKTSNSCVYYMSGVFYSNFPYHRKEENLEKIDNGDFISILVDMDKGFIEYILKNFTKMISIGRARRLRFAVTMKVSSRIRIVQEEEAMGLSIHKTRQV